MEIVVSCGVFSENFDEFLGLKVVPLYFLFPFKEALRPNQEVYIHCLGDGILLLKYGGQELKNFTYAYVLYGWPQRFIWKKNSLNEELIKATISLLIETECFNGL